MKKKIGIRLRIFQKFPENLKKSENLEIFFLPSSVEVLF